MPVSHSRAGDESTEASVISRQDHHADRRADDAEHAVEDGRVAAGSTYGLLDPDGAGKPSPGLRDFFAWGEMVSGRGCAGAAAGPHADPRA